jgi:hypothetical protein
VFLPKAFEMHLKQLMSAQARRASALATIGVAAVVLASCEPAREEEPEFAEPGAVAEVKDTQLQWCDPIAQRVTLGDCLTAERTLEKVESGTALIAWPKSIRRGERATIRLEIGNAPASISKSAAVDSEAAEAAEAAAAEAGAVAESSASASNATQSGGTAATNLPPAESGSVETTPYSPFVGRFMSAQLTGAGFDIAPSAPVSKELPPNSQIDWEWEVVAKYDGLQTLVVTTNVEFKDSSGKRIPLRVTQEKKSFDVKVGVLGWIEDALTEIPDWLKLVTGVLVALTGTVSAYFGLKKVWKSKGDGTS